MMDVVKGSLFDMLESMGGVRGYVLDLFGGTGSLGIEALSRGANHADFVEQDRAACKVITENLQRLDFRRRGTVVCKSVEHFLRSPQVAVRGAPQASYGASGHCYDIVFMDAPYRSQVSHAVLTSLSGWPRLCRGAVVCVGHHRNEAISQTVSHLRRIRHRRFGASCISIFELVGPS